MNLDKLWDDLLERDQAIPGLIHTFTPEMYDCDSPELRAAIFRGTRNQCYLTVLTPSRFSGKWGWGAYDLDSLERVDASVSYSFDNPREAYSAAREAIIFAPDPPSISDTERIVVCEDIPDDI